MTARSTSRFRSDAGATAVEYGLVVALIAVVIIVAVGFLGTNLKSIFLDAAGGDDGSVQAAVVVAPDMPCSSLACSTTTSRLIFDVRTILGKNNAKVTSIVVTDAGSSAVRSGAAAVSADSGTFAYSPPPTPVKEYVTYTYTYRVGFTTVIGSKTVTVNG